MTKNELRSEIDPCLTAICSNIQDAENALCHVLAVADYADRLTKHGHSVTFAILQRNALANLVLSLHKAFEGDDKLTVCRITKTIEDYTRHYSLPLDPIVHVCLLEWLSPDTVDHAADSDDILDADVIRRLIDKTRKLSPRGDIEKWAQFDALRHRIAHNCSFSKAEEKAGRDDLIQYLDFLVGTEHAFRYIFGFSMNFEHSQRCVGDFRDERAYSELSEIIEAFLAKTRN